MDTCSPCFMSCTSITSTMFCPAFLKSFNMLRPPQTTRFFSSPSSFTRNTLPAALEWRDLRL